MSYTQYDERTSYVIPDGTEVIGDHAIATVIILKN